MSLRENSVTRAHFHLGDSSIWCQDPMAFGRSEGAFVAHTCMAGDLHVGLPDLTPARAREYAAALISAADEADRINAERADAGEAHTEGR